MANKKQIKVEGITINWHTINQEDYISLTDMANWDSDPNARIRVRNWLKRGNTILYIEAWEKMHNPDFNYVQMDAIKIKLLQESYILSPKRFIEETNALGIRASAGRYGGTYAHSDIALEFATWLNPVFKLYLITEFKRLKTQEAKQQNLEWNANRFLSKRNYRLQTEAVKYNLLPLNSREPEDDWITYAEEADLLNVALFGMSAKEWRAQNPKKGENIRDYASNIQLIVLSNLEAINSELIHEAVSKGERYLRLRQAANFQLGIFYRDHKLLDWDGK